MPYAGERFALAIMMPVTETDGPARLTEKQLDAMLAALAEAEPRRVALFLPKFAIETDADLIPAFKASGMRLPFDSGAAEFPELKVTDSTETQIYITQIRHRAVFEVDEAGTEAGAATAVELALRSAQARPEEFRIDRPFLFALTDNETGTVLFLGRVTDPRS